MKKIAIAILIIVLVCVSAGLVYLNAVVLPVKVKSIIQKSIEDATGKNVSIDSVRVGLINGLVLRNVVISDGAKPMVSAKEVSLRPFILPFFKKEFIVPVIRIKAPVIDLERRADGTFNLADLFNNPNPKAGEFRVVISRINIKDGKLDFTDNALAEPFKKEAKNLNADIRLLLPSKIRFEADCDMASGLSTIIGVWGEYFIPDGSFTAKVTLTDVSPAEYAPYYKDTGVNFQSGKADALLNVKYSKSLIKADVNIRAKEIGLAKDAISAKFGSDIKAECSYDLTDKVFKYSGDMTIKQMQIEGIKNIGKIENLRSEVKFTDSSFYAKDIKAVMLDMPFTAEAYIQDYKSPLLVVDIASDLSLGALKAILKDRFNISIPADIRGGGKLCLKWETGFGEEDAKPELNGYLDMNNATITFNKDKPPLEIASGQIQFTPKQFTWSELDVKYRETFYSTSGALTNFSEPGIQISVKSRDLALKAAASLNGKVITFSKFSGKYLGSTFSLNGIVDMSGESGVVGDVAGTVETSFEEIKAVAKQTRDKLEKMKLSGALKADVKLSGRINDIKMCAIDARVFSNSLSIYDLKPVDVIIDYTQRGGVGTMTRFHSFLYDGTVSASGKMDFNAPGLPYTMNADIAGVRIEGLKTATPFKDKDISGTLRLQAHVEGLYENSSTAAGGGRIAITDGRLWQLNLFKGLGALLFSRDFENVVFRDGGCSFIIKDEAFRTEDLSLRSGLLDLYGSVVITFDKNISAALKSEFTDDALSSGSVSNAAANIGRYSYITIKGSLKEPKYAVRPDVPNIVMGIADQIFNN
jgi:hypothetical protein